MVKAAVPPYLVDGAVGIMSYHFKGPSSKHIVLTRGNPAIQSNLISLDNVERHTPCPQIQDAMTAGDITSSTSK